MNTMGFTYKSTCTGPLHCKPNTCRAYLHVSSTRTPGFKNLSAFQKQPHKLSNGKVRCKALACLCDQVLQVFKEILLEKEKKKLVVDCIYWPVPMYQVHLPSVKTWRRFAQFLIQYLYFKMKDEHL